jgi:3-oxoadipate enol-lactonase
MPGPSRPAPAHEVVGSGPPVVLVPGTFSDRRVWRRLVGALSPGFRCLLLDPRGTGATPDPGRPFTPDDLADDLLAAMDAAGFERAHLVGHSLGAVVATLAAARHPARAARLVAIGPALRVDARLAAALDHWEALARSDLSDEALHRGLVLLTFGRDAFDRIVPAVVHDLGRRPIARDTVARYVACGRAQDLRPLAGRVDAPALLVAGAEDALTGPPHARALAEAVPDGRLALVEGSGHTPQLERPAELARLVVSFLRG